MKWIIALIGLILVSSFVFAGTNFNKNGTGCILSENDVLQAH